MCSGMAGAPRDPYFLLWDVLKVTPGARGMYLCEGGGTWEGRDVPAACDPPAAHATL